MRTCTLAHSYIRRNRNDTKLRKSDIRGYYIDRSGESRRVFGPWLVHVENDRRHEKLTLSFEPLLAPFHPQEEKTVSPIQRERDRMPRKLSSILGKQLRCWPTPKLPPSEAFPFNRREFIYLPALSLSLFSKLSKFSSFLVRGNSMFRLKQRRIEK